MMKLNIIFLVCVAGMLTVGHGASEKRHPDPENEHSRRSNTKSLYRRPQYDNGIDQKSVKQRREVGGIQKRSCNGDEFQCADGTCVDLFYRCDIYLDCPDDSDEIGCDCSQIEGFRCGDGLCIWKEWKCDNEPDCFDGSDEGSICDVTCLSLDLHQVCDHEWDCESGFDESDCEPMQLGTSVTIASKNYDSTYPNDLNQTWTFVADQGLGFTLTIKDFETEAKYDYLLVGTGNFPDTGKAVKKFSGTLVYTDFTTNENTLWLRFVSDFSVGLKGFQAVVTVVSEVVETSDDIDYCGWNNYIAQTRIIAGVDSNIEKWPWQAMLLKKTNSYHYPYYFKCGGTLISDRHILTAAHCVDTGSASDFQIALGKNYTSLQVNEGIRRYVSNINIHEDYRESTYEHDIAVLTLDAPVNIPNSLEDLRIKFSINKACVDRPGNQWDENDKCFITGYGYLNGTTEERSERLQEAKVTYMNQVDCEENSFFQGLGLLSPFMICGGGVNGSDSCQGDSGGPLVCQHPTLNYSVVGITSFGFGCGSKGWPGVYTSVADYYSWIMANML
ncbi:Atrial natriuretic peptide-converting enzyme [Holothuria leucospilota]|uniref:Atrial natriuretic peptide-converting enzyme n=1 Tax=Holothuria leucospilota TaxID=206669 RepID=A0A9Q1HBQ4_HOLLE|nr:Atrial natriuretic peptide-converting enzyme [Holothuria leucospilota]